MADPPATHKVTHSVPPVENLTCCDVVSDIAELEVRPLVARNIVLIADRISQIRQLPAQPSGRVAAEIEYDTVNERVQTYTDRNGGKWKLGAPVVGGEPTNLIRTVQFSDPGNRNHIFDYDPVKGRILRTVTPLGLGVRSEDQLDQTPAAVEYGIRTYDYDDKGNQNTIVAENLNTVTMGFDARGNVTTKRTCRTGLECYSEYYDFFYDAANPLDPRNDMMIARRDGRSTDKNDNRYKTTFDYNIRGDLRTQTMPDGSTVRHFYTDGTEEAVDTPNL